MTRIMMRVFEWCALLTWSVIVGAALMYGILYGLNIIYSGPRSSLEKLPDRFMAAPHRVADVRR